MRSCRSPRRARIFPRVSPDADPAEAQGEAVAVDAEQRTVANRLDRRLQAGAADGHRRDQDDRGWGQVRDLQGRNRARVKRGQRGTFHYVGTLEKTTKSSIRRRTSNAPRSFRIGGDPLIRGWEEALPGMKVGEIRKLIDPPRAGLRGDGQTAQIPPNATLIFEVELLNIAADEK